jgi:hypothetical protein
VVVLKDKTGVNYNFSGLDFQEYENHDEEIEKINTDLKLQ